MRGDPHRDMVIVQPEVDLVAWFDPELVSQLLGDDDLPLGPDAMSHTNQYNQRRTSSGAPWLGCDQVVAVGDQVEDHGSGTSAVRSR